MKHLRYLSYVLRHKWFVFLAGLSTGAPLWRLIIHDWSKFLPCEWSAYASNFFGGHDKNKRPPEVVAAFDRAWLHHIHANPHHWEHWNLKDGPVFRALPTPEHFVREMVADWMGAGRAITGRWEVREWYEKNRERIVLHIETRRSVESILGIPDRPTLHAIAENLKRKAEGERR